MATTTRVHSIISIILLFISTALSSSSHPYSRSLNSTQAPLLQPHTIYSYPKGTWLENLVIRESDSNALVTILSTPEVHLISTTNSTPPLRIATIPSATGCSGIVELSHDISFVLAGNWSTSTFLSTPGSYSIWELDLRAGTSPESISVRKLASLPSAGFLNGLAVANPVQGILLAADSLLGVVWSINAYTGVVDIAINDTATMAPIPRAEGGIPLGINSLLVRDEYLYYANSDRASFSRIPIDLSTAHATGPAQTLLQANYSVLTADDFAIDFAGNIWLTSDPLSELVLLRGAGAVGAGGNVGADKLGGSTAIAAAAAGGLDVVSAASAGEGVAGGWTAAKFGTSREDVKRGSLYVTTNGGPEGYMFGNWTEGGQLVRIDTAELGIY